MAMLTTLRFQALYFYAAKTPVFVEQQQYIYFGYEIVFHSLPRTQPIPPFLSLHRHFLLFTNSLGGDARLHIVYWPSFHFVRARLARNVDVGLRVH